MDTDNPRSGEVVGLPPDDVNLFDHDPLLWVAVSGEQRYRAAVRMPCSAKICLCARSSAHRTIGTVSAQICAQVPALFASVRILLLRYFNILAVDFLVRDEGVRGSNP